MGSYLRKILRGKNQTSSPEPQVLQPPVPLSTDLEQTIAVLQGIFSQTPDLIQRDIVVQSTGQRAVLFYLHELTDFNALNNNILKPLMQEDPDARDIEQIVTVGSVLQVHDFTQVERKIFEGNSVLFVAGERTARVFNTQGWPQRSIADPQLEASLKGSHQGFVETATQNIAMIRRFLPHRELKIKEHVVGARGMTKVSVLYVADVARPEILQELEDRIEQLDVDAVLSSGELEELIEDNPYSPFPQFASTERPDSVASQLLQGRLAVVVDRSPGVLIGPTTFAMYFQSVDDYSIRWQISTFLRILRFTAFFVTILLPAIYISLISFNYEVIPLQLLLSVGESRGNVPFPPLLEAFIMEITLEFLKEAGIRLPAPIGQTVGIVGAIVIGQATVQAGIVSNIMVIVVSLTALASFIIPNYDMSSTIRLIRFPMMVAAGLFGLIGVGIGMMILVGHLIALESLGTPYFSPISPVRFADWKDTFVRMPLWSMKNRPVSARPIQKKRQGSNSSEGDRK